MNASYTDWSLVSLSPWSLATIITLTLLAAVAAAVVLFSYRHSAGRLGLTLLRLLGLFVVVGMLVEPALQLRVVRKVKDRLAIIVDTSKSMTLGAGDHSRYDNTMATLDAAADDLKALGEDHLLEWYSLDGPISPKSLQQPPAGDETRLMEALARVRHSGSGKPLAGIVLISDGADTTDRLLPLPLNQERKDELQSLGAPITTLDPTEARDFRDIAITDVITDEFAFLHNTLEVEVLVQNNGFDTVTLPLTLRLGDQVLQTKQAVLSEGNVQSVIFSFKPDTIGEFIFTIECPVLDGEAVTHNNRKVFVLQVIRDKIRVLHVTGRPSWDERFLRQHLKENPNVDLVAFFILRTPSDDPRAPEQELSLIPFPTDRLFTTELSNFDVVIFQNFDYRPYRMRQYLPNIRDAVRGGLGFVMIGGEQSFGSVYQGTEIDEILPLRMDVQGFEQGSFKGKPTPQGERHPVTDLTRSRGNNMRLWAEMPGWTWANITAGAMPSATVLVADSKRVLPGGEPLPLISVMDVEQGRTMAIASNELWRWRFAKEHHGGASERAYHRFWSNALRWLVKDPEHSKVRVIPQKRRFDLSQTPRVTLKVLGHDYRPLAGAQLRASLSRSDGTTLRMDDLRSNDEGVAEMTYENLKPGAYRVSVDANHEGKNAGHGEGVFLLQSLSPELARATPRADVLKAIAETTDGAYRPLDPGAFKEIPIVDPDVVEVSRRRNIELWDNGIAMALVVLVLAGEWALRRRRGYL